MQNNTFRFTSDQSEVILIELILRQIWFHLIDWFSIDRLTLVSD